MAEWEPGSPAEAMRGQAFAVRGWAGVAFQVVGHPVADPQEPVMVCTLDELHDECDYVLVTDEEPGEDWSRVIVVMVGDDREHVVQVEDLEPLGDGAWCGECGQIGCTNDGREE